MKHRILALEKKAAVSLENCPLCANLPVKICRLSSDDEEPPWDEPPCPRCGDKSERIRRIVIRFDGPRRPEDPLPCWE
jgi:hypothetical protein